MIITHLVLFNFFTGASSEVAVSCTLVSRTGASQNSLTNISWAWFDNADPNDFSAPTDQGQIESTDADGLIELSLPNSTLTSGQTGSLVLRSDDGVNLGYYNLSIP